MVAPAPALTLDPGGRRLDPGWVRVVSVHGVLPRPLTWLLVLLACLLLPIALVSSWVAAQVGDTDEYVSTVAPLAEEQVLLDAAHTEVEQEVLRRLGPAASSRPQVTNALDRSLTRVLEGPEFPTVWEQGNRVLHRQVLRILESDGTTNPGRWVRLDLAPLADDLTRALADEGVDVPGSVAERDLRVNALPRAEVEQARGYYELLDTAGFWLPVGWLVLAAVALLTARRRIATLGHLAFGSLVALSALAAALVLARWEVVGDADSVLSVLWETLTRGLWSALLTSAAVAAVVLLVRVVLGVVRRGD